MIWNYSIQKKKKKIENGISHGSYQKQKLQNLNRIEQQKLRLQND